MTDSAMLHVRIDGETKDRASEALAHMGLSLSEAIRVFLKRVVAEQAIPFELKVPNAATQEAMMEARAIRDARFVSPDQLFDNVAMTLPDE